MAFRQERLDKDAAAVSYEGNDVQGYGDEDLQRAQWVAVTSPGRRTAETMMMKMMATLV